MHARNKDRLPSLYRPLRVDHGLRRCTASVRVPGASSPDFHWVSQTLFVIICEYFPFALAWGTHSGGPERSRGLSDSYSCALAVAITAEAVLVDHISSPESSST